MTPAFPHHAFTLVVIVGAFACAPRPADQNTEVVVNFTNAHALRDGDPVMTSGVTVGRVTSIKLVKPGDVVVHLRVRDNLPARADATAQVGALDLLGTRYVNYDPGSSAAPATKEAIRGKPELLPLNPPLQNE